MDPKEFRARYGPVAVVAGASEGLGEAFAEAIASRGLDLVLVARRAPRLEMVASRIAATHGVRARPVALDLGRPNASGLLLAEAPPGQVGLLVYDAAVSPIGEFVRVPLEEHVRLLDVNCRTPMLLAHAYAPEMAARGRGGILLMSSMAGFQGTAMVAHYAASKAYLTTLAEGLACELGPRGVDVLACCAGATRTPGFVASRPASSGAPVMDPRTVVEAALDALPEGGGSMIPGVVNRVAAGVLRVMPRKLAVRVISRSTRQMYDHAADPDRTAR